MIEVIFFHQGNGDQIAGLEMHHTPAIGEKIWLRQGDAPQKHYKVTDVAHWVYMGTNGDHTAAVSITPDE